MSLPRRIPPELPGGEVIVRKPAAVGQVWRAVPCPCYPEGRRLRVLTVLGPGESGVCDHGEIVLGDLDRCEHGSGGGWVARRLDGTPEYEGWSLVEELPG